MSGNYQHILLYLKYNWSASGAHILPSKSIFITNYQIYSKLSRFSGKLLEIEFSPTHLRVQQSITKDILWVHFQKCLGEFLWSHALGGYVREFLPHTAMTHLFMYAHMHMHVPVYIYSFIHSTYVFIILKMYAIDIVVGKSDEWIPPRWMNEYITAETVFTREPENTKASPLLHGYMTKFGETS